MKIKRLIAIGLAVTLLLVALTACGNSKDNLSQTTDPQATAETTAENLFKDPMEISVANWDIENNLADAENDALFQSVCKKFNITIKPVNITWDDYVDKINIWASSGQLPDLFSADKATTVTYKTWAEQGVVHALPDDLGKFPYLAKSLSVPDAQALKIDGKLYCIPRGVYDQPRDWSQDHVMLYRWDWAQKLGITKEPETWDEYEAMLTAFVNSDPEGKGKPVGVIPKVPSYLYALTMPLNPVGEWVKEDGKWIPRFLSKQQLPAIKAVKSWYDKGLMDKDFVLAKGTEAEDKFLSGRAGAFLGGATPSDMFLWEKEKWDKNYPDKDMYESLKVWKIPPSADGKRYCNTSKTYWSEAYINANVTDDKLQRILSLADYMLSPEGIHYSSGILGVDYNLDENGKAVSIDPSVDIMKKYPTIKADGGFPKLFNWVQNLQVAFDLPEYNPEMVAFTKANYAWYEANTLPQPIDFQIDNIKTPGMEKLVMNENDDLTKLVMTKGDVDVEYDNIVKGYMDKGLDLVIKEMNDEAAKLGK